MDLNFASFLCSKPIWNCPQEYENYISDEKKHEILSVSSGLYSFRIPVFPVCVTVLDADKEKVKAEIKYMFFGYVDLYLTEDGFYSTDLFGR